MNTEALLFALNEADDEAILQAGQKLSGKPAGRLRAHPVRVMLIAAALLFALGGVGWTVYQCVLTARIPEKGEALIYRDVMYQPDGEEQSVEIRLQNAALVVHVTSAEDSRLCLFKLPEEGGRRNLNAILEHKLPYEGAHLVKYPNIPLEPKEALKQAGMNLEEATEYGNYWFLNDEEDYYLPELSVELLNACELYRHDLILGWAEKGEAEIVQQREDEEHVDVEVFYRLRLDSRYLFRYDKQLRYLLVICGDAEKYAFSDLEELADSLRVRQTDLTVRYDENEGRDYRVISTRDTWLDAEERENG